MAALPTTGLSRDQKKLLALILSLSGLTAVEYFYGFLAVDVRAVADSVQATLHIVALCVSFFAIGLALQPKDEAFSYGYDRVEALAAFTNCCFVILEVTFNFVHQLHDVILTVMGNTNHAHFEGASARVSLWRCVVNMGGLALFSREVRAVLHRSTRQRSTCLSAHAENTAAVVIKLFASVTTYMATAVADATAQKQHLPTGLDLPLSLLFGTTIVYVVLPPLAATGRVLLLAVPTDVQPALSKCLREVSFVDGVLEVLQWSFWPITGAQPLVGTVSVRVRPDADSASVLKAVREACSRVCGDLTVQVVREQPLDMLLADRQRPV